MVKLADYRDTTPRLTEVLPWALLVAKGVILNKDGSLQRTLRYRGPDLESASQEQLVGAMARLNNALKRLGSAWVIYVEAKRQEADTYLTQSVFPDPASWLIDAERRSHFEASGQKFESHYFLTLQYLPPEEQATNLASLFIKRPAKTENYEQDLDFFISNTQRFFDILKDTTYEAAFLDDSESLSYLHNCVSDHPQKVNAPEIPMYLDALLADRPLLGGIAPQLGSQHLRTLSIMGFPGSSVPALLDQLNQLPLSYRWVTRYIPLDKTAAEKELKRYRQRWFAKRKGVMNMVQELFTKSESQLVDTAAVEKARDADLAMRELAEDFVSFGYYTSTVTVMHADLSTAESMLHEVERVINGLGFTTIPETFNAVEAWLSSIPGHAYANVRRPLLHTLNLAHLLPFSAIWPGPDKIAHLHDAPPLMMVDTHGRTPFRLSNFLGDVGHQMIIGPTGAGKSVLLNLMALQFCRYKKAQVFIFDKGGSFMCSTHAVGGSYFELGLTEGLSFQPLAYIHQEQERVWAAEWLHELLTLEKVILTPAIKLVVWEALSSLATLPINQRTLTGFRAMVQNDFVRQALSHYTLTGPFGFLLDGDQETLSNKHWQCFEMEALMSMRTIIAPVLSYLFHRLEKKFTGVPTLLLLDEAWLFLDHPQFAGQIRNWLKTLRKFNVAVIFATQSVEDALNTSIAPALLESCPSRILLPNDRILEPRIHAAYEKLGLNERQCQILSSALPKRQYYYQSSLGNRLFDVECGPIALALCAAAKPEDKALIRQIVLEHGEEHFLEHYLAAMGLSWAWLMIKDHF